MAKTLYCWRCKKEIPMLEEHEWEQFAPLLSNTIQQIKDYLEKHNATLAQAIREGHGTEALARYYEITGHREPIPTTFGITD